jgi:hypothetical protein
LGSGGLEPDELRNCIYPLSLGKVRQRGGHRPTFTIYKEFLVDGKPRCLATPARPVGGDRPFSLPPARGPAKGIDGCPIR